ncbi:MAG: hypothetical protein COB26_11265 [Piscirickettsiaceae bacterium]|nr:MAG: hypothetical protein COB89_01275 [Piscirickettsiaceae bacterium]PCI66466.1 MAG: hypothetical protein COB26_11265 [Piscirickettsiaceae bacterium]
MNNYIKPVRLGLAMIMLALFFGVGMGVSFGVSEDTYKSYVSENVAKYPNVHDEKSNSKIWRYAQRAHFHSTGIAAFSLGLVVLTMFTTLSATHKTWTSFLIGLGGLYPLSWYLMFYLAPTIGRSAAHSHIMTELITYVGVGGLLLGMLMLSMNLFLGMFEGDH